MSAGRAGTAAWRAADQPRWHVAQLRGEQAGHTGAQRRPLPSLFTRVRNLEHFAGGLAVGMHQLEHLGLRGR